MRRRDSVLTALFLVGLGLMGARAQNAVSAGGGNLPGIGGSVSYTIGQVSYNTIASCNGLFSQGVQQPYEIQTSISGSVNGSSSVCMGINSTLLSLSGQTGIIQKWQFSTNDSIWTDIPDTTAQYTAENLTVETKFRAIVLNGGCEYPSSPATISMLVLPVPTIGGPDEICAGTAGLLYTTEPGKTGYDWSVSAGGVITSGAGTNQITVAWNNPGSESVNVSYMDVNGCSPSEPTMFEVIVNPHPYPGITGPSTICEGTGIVVYFTETGMTNYNWTISPGGSIFYGGGVNDPFVLVSWNSSEQQSVSLIYTNSFNCTAPGSTILPVFMVPVPAPTITGDTVQCEGTSGISYTTEPGMSGYLWDVSSGGTVTAGTGTNAILVSWQMPGEQLVRVTYSDANGCNGTSPDLPVTVNPSSPVTISIATANNPVYAGGQATFFATSENEGPNPIYQWKVNGVTTGTSAPVFTYFPENEDTVICILTSDANCPSSNPAISNPVIMIVNPVPSIIITSPNGGESWQQGFTYAITWTDNLTEDVEIRLCKGGIFIGQIISAIPSTGTFNWLVPFNLTGGDDYSIKIVSAADTTIYDASNENFTIYSSLPSEITVQNLTLFNGQSRCFEATQTIRVAGNGSTFIIENGGSAVMIAGQNILYLPGVIVESGGHMHGYITTDGIYCSSPDAASIVTADDGSEGPAALNGNRYKIYPNPNDGNFVLSIEGSPATGAIRIDIYDLLGNSILSKVVNGERIVDLTISGRPTGIYLLRIISLENAETIRLLKQ